MGANNIYEIKYDTITLTGLQAVAAKATYRMFSVPFDGSSKYRWQTNQVKANQCDYSVMNVMGIYVRVFTNSVAVMPTMDDVEKFIKNCSLTIYKNTVPVYQTPLAKIGGGNQLTGFITNTNASALSIPTNGIAHLDEMFKFAGSSSGTGIQFVQDEQLDIQIVAETTFTPSATVYAQLGFYCDTWQTLGSGN